MITALWLVCRAISHKAWKYSQILNYLCLQANYFQSNAISGAYLTPKDTAASLI